MKRLLVGVAGASGSGKTTFGRRIARELGEDRVLLLSVDRYYKDLGGIRMARRNAVNFDDPGAIDWPLLRRQATALLKGRCINAPVYSFATHARKGSECVESRDVIIVEGIFALCDPWLCRQMDVRFFVDTPSDICLVRRIQRDIIERGRDLQSVVEQWLKFVRPAHERFIAPSARQAHVIIPEDPEGGNRDVAALLLKHSLHHLASAVAHDRHRA